MLECVINISEGRDRNVIGRLVSSCEGALLDLHVDVHHNRSVFTLAATDLQTPARRLASAAIETIDLNTHEGVHPRIGVVDVVPFVPILSTGSGLGDALVERERFADWFAHEHGVPCFLYGSGISLPEIRRSAFEKLMSHVGPSEAHPTAGSCAVGARMPLVAYNLWLDEPLTRAKQIAKAVRQEGLRTLGLEVGGSTQVSCNLVDPNRIGPTQAYDLVARHARIRRAELVGLVPREVEEAIPRSRLEQLDVDPSKTIETRLATLEN